MSYHLGVDLGTTYTAVAAHHDARSEIVGLGTRAASVPTVVFLRDDHVVLTGEAANRRAVAEPGRVAREFKRRLGDPTPILLGGTPYSPEALMAELLRSVVATVAERHGGHPCAITLTHPANWGPYKLDLLGQTVRLAGLSDVGTLSEPEAAAIHYASTARVEAGEVVAVYDLGGGTFDAAVLRKTATGFEILGAPEGIDRLGGVDFDQAVFGFVARALDGALDALDHDDPATLAALARLRQECVEAKEALSGDSQATVPVLLPGVQTEVRITRAEFESMVRPTLGETIRALHRALDGAGVAPEEVTAVLLVGGSSRIPLVAELVETELGRPVAVDVHPKHAVALGAALHAADGSGDVELEGIAQEGVAPGALEHSASVPLPVGSPAARAGPDGDGELALAAASAGRGDAACPHPPDIELDDGGRGGHDELRPAALAQARPGPAPQPPVASTVAVPVEWGGSLTPFTGLVEAPPLPEAPSAPRSVLEEQPATWGTSAALPPERPRPLPPAPSSTSRRWLVALPVAVVLVVALVAGGLFLARTSSSSSDGAAEVPVRYAFRPVALDSGLVLARTWELSAGDGDRFHAVVRLTNGTDAPVSDSHNEVIPKSLAADVDVIAFSPMFDELVEPDPIVRYFVDDLPPGEALVFSYDIEVEPEGADMDRLVAWARDQAEALAALSADERFGEAQVVGTLDFLAIFPDRLELDEGDRFTLQLSGKMDDGTPAPPAVLDAVAWSSQAPNVVLVDDAGGLEARQQGTTTVSAQAGDLVQKAVVTVTPGAAPSAAPGRVGGGAGGPASTAPSNDGGTDPPGPPPPAACADRNDNDGDGRVDLADPGCASPRDGDETDRPAACADGTDNDRDGKTDLRDGGCTSPSDDDEREPPAACADGSDNDGDGKTDLADPGCSSSGDGDEVDPPACADRRDNDGDGKTDLADPGCSSPADVDEVDPPACADGSDNDNDGKTDLADPGCSSPADVDETDPPACADGSDNDNDGKIDLADPGCSSPEDSDEADPVTEPPPG